MKSIPSIKSKKSMSILERYAHWVTRKFGYVWGEAIFVCSVVAAAMAIIAVLFLLNL